MATPPAVFSQTTGACSPPRLPAPFAVFHNATKGIRMSLEKYEKEAERFEQALGFIAAQVRFNALAISETISEIGTLDPAAKKRILDKLQSNNFDDSERQEFWEKARKSVIKNVR
jgi:hypothetical protein